MILVLGAGIIGTTTAYALASRGHAVTLVDRHPGAALGASCANGAQLSYAYADALASPKLLASLPRLIAGADPLFKVHLSARPDFLRWGTEFVAAAASQQQATLTTLKLALESQAALAKLLDRHNIAFDYAVAGKMHLYFSAAALDAARASVALKQAHGVNQSILTPAEATAIEPMLAHIDGLAGIVHSPDDAVGDPHLFARELVALGSREHGLATRFNTEVTGLEITDSRAIATTASGEQLVADTLVVTAGPQAAALLKPVGERAAILPMKGYSITAPPGNNPPRVSLTDTSRKIVIAPLGKRIRIAGIAEINAGSTEIDPEQLDTLIAAAREAFPGAANYEAIDHRWAGLRPMTPDSVPIITRPHPRLVLNIGHGMLGWTLAMGSAERTAALLQDVRPRA
jgi:D-amino-acid dehydrogenase